MMEKIIREIHLQKLHKLVPNPGSYFYEMDNVLLI